MSPDSLGGPASAITRPDSGSLWTPVRNSGDHRNWILQYFVRLVNNHCPNLITKVMGATAIRRENFGPPKPDSTRHYHPHRICEMAPLRLFADLQHLNWNEIEFMFTSSDTLRISCRGKETQHNFESLGFSDHRSVGKPNTLWELLLSLAEYNGVIPWKNNLAANKKLPKKIQLLRDQLQLIAGLSSDPFYPYRQLGEYRARFQIWVQRKHVFQDTSAERGSEISEVQDLEINKYTKHKLSAV